MYYPKGYTALKAINNWVKKTQGCVIVALFGSSKSVLAISTFCKE
ncbi:hypothetical protein FDUTEX481_02381 [Tolypothrix sp. PCC 7601]|nr:hypothetical protein FDUTEX481_02381 [Tolypothrix sp. PCC 7601]